MTGIEDVASLAGVSKATVSRALSGRGYVAPATRDRVETAASTLGYVVSSSASSLVTGRTNTVGVIIPVINQWFFGSVIEGVERGLIERGYDLMLYNLTKSPAERTLVFDYFLVRKRVDAIVAMTLEMNNDEAASLLALGKPIAGIGSPLNGIPTFSIDDVAAARLATEHLIALGHTNIVHVGGSTEGKSAFSVHARREEGYRATMEAAGLTANVTRFVASPFDIPGGFAAGRQLLGDPRSRPTAIFAGADELAIGIIVAARELGISIPDELSVIGIDNHPLAETFGLTSISQSPVEQGALAADLVIRKLEEPEWQLPASHRYLPADLIIRSSTSRPSQR